MVAYHEAGHTIVGMVLSDARIVHKVTIVPRGRAGGYAIMLPKEDRFLMTKDELLEQVVGLLGGRVAEEVVFNVQTTGASNDFEQATGLIRSMVTEYGMSSLGPIFYEARTEFSWLAEEFGEKAPISEEMSAKIDAEITKIIDNSYKEAKRILTEKRETLDRVANKLLEVETIDGDEFKKLLD